MSLSSAIKETNNYGNRFYNGKQTHFSTTREAKEEQSAKPEANYHYYWTLLLKSDFGHRKETLGLFRMKSGNSEINNDRKITQWSDIPS